MLDGQRTILRFLDEYDIWLTPRNIARNLDLSPGYVRRQCKQLAETYGVLHREAAGTKPFYTIAERGQIALEQGTLDVEYSYHGRYHDRTWEVCVQPSGQYLRDYGPEYYGKGKISWGAQGGDKGAFNLAQNLLRHAVGETAVEECAFEYYQSVTRRLGSEADHSFTLTESEIAAWVSAQTDADTEAPDMLGSDMQVVDPSEESETVEATDRDDNADAVDHS